jgi:hypothetical protein
VFGDGATIKTVPLVNVLAACVNNPFALLEIADCTAHLAEGGKKDAKYIAKIIMPLIHQIESEEDMHKNMSPGIFDLVFFDGASNVQNAGEIVRVFNPRITVGHGAEHVVSLFFANVYTKVKSCMLLSAFVKRVHNIFWCSEAQPLGNVQEVQPLTQSWCPPWICEALRMTDGWQAHCHTLIATTEECAYINYSLQGVY